MSAPLPPTALGPSCSSSVRQGVRVLPALASDALALAEIYGRAFLPLGFSQALFGKADPELVIQQLAERFEKLLDLPRHVIHKAVRPAKEGAEETIVGFGWWETPDLRSDEEKLSQQGDKVERNWAPGTDVAQVEALFAELDSFASTIVGPHYHLQMLATDPEHQRTGAGSALVKWGLERAESERVEVWLEATVEGVPLYERLGFVEGGRAIELRNRKAAVYPMVYKPSSSK